MRPSLFVLVAAAFLVFLSSGWADDAFLAQATAWLNDGQVDKAGQSAEAVLAAHPDDADALLIRGTVLLERSFRPVYDASIFRPRVDGNSPLVPHLMPTDVEAVAQSWKRVVALDPSRAYLWADLAELAFRAGDASLAVEHARKVLDLPTIDSHSAQEAATVEALDLNWDAAATLYEKVNDSRAALYRGLALWVADSDGWKKPLSTYIKSSPAEAPGHALAVYMTGPSMRATSEGIKSALDTESGVPSLALRQKLALRDSTQFDARLGLARALLQFGNYQRALAEYAEIDRLALAETPQQKRAIQFHTAWAWQASSHPQQADKIWKDLADANEYYVRSASCWFLGANARDRGDRAAARSWWNQIADEPLRSKYSAWAAYEVKALAP